MQFKRDLGARGPPPPGYGYPPPQPGQRPPPAYPPAQYPPAYYPPPGYPPPPSQKKDSAIIWVVVVVVILIIAVPAIAAFMWLGITSSLTEPEHEYITMNIGAPTVTRRTITDEPYWDVSLNINKLTPKDETVPWSDIRVVVKSDYGAVLNPTTRPIPDDPLEYDDGSDGSVDVQFWYDASIPGNDFVMAGDTIKITGMTENYEGGRVEIFYRGERIGETTLPTDFP